MKLKNLTKKKAVIILLILAVVLAAAVIACGPKRGFIGFGNVVDVSTPQGRMEYLSSLGWEIDVSTEEVENVTLPESFDAVAFEYAELQTEQGFEFSSYCGCECERYTYEVKNYSAYDGTVYAVLFIKNGTVIGGDIHSAEIDGFMMGIK